MIEFVVLVAAVAGIFFVGYTLGLCYGQAIGRREGIEALGDEL